MAYVNPQSGFTTKPDYAGALSSLAGMLRQRQALGVQNKQFGMQMGMQQQGMQQQQQRFESEMALQKEKFFAGEEQWAKSFEETKRMNDADMARIDAAMDLIKIQREQEKKKQEAMTIMGAEAGLEGESKYTTPEQWSEHPGIKEAGLSGVVLGLGEEISGFAPDETAQLREAKLIYESAQFGVPWESLGMDESLRSIYDEGAADKARGVERDEAQIKQMLRGPSGPRGPSSQTSSYSALDQMIIHGQTPTPEQFEAAGIANPEAYIQAVRTGGLGVGGPGGGGGGPELEGDAKTLYDLEANYMVGIGEGNLTVQEVRDRRTELQEHLQWAYRTSEIAVTTVENMLARLENELDLIAQKKEEGRGKAGEFIAGLSVG